MPKTEDQQEIVKDSGPEMEPVRIFSTRPDR